jgi:hypothetical protein
VLQLAAPLPGGSGPGDAADDLAPDLAGLPRPLTALLVPRPDAPYELTREAARELAGIAAREAAADGGGVAAWIDPLLPPAVADAVRAALRGEHRVLAGTGAEAAHSLAGTADRVVLPGGAPGLLADACVAGRPVLLMETPRGGGGAAMARPFERLLGRVIGGSTYRGTPMQQHFPGRIVDWLATQGLAYRPRDLEALHRSLEARGLLTRVGSAATAEPVARPRPLDDLARSVERVRRLLHEAPQAG